jgi:hypothetical protein
MLHEVFSQGCGGPFLVYTEGNVFRFIVVAVVVSVVAVLEGELPAGKRTV